MSDDRKMDVRMSDDRKRYDRMSDDRKRYDRMTADPNLDRCSVGQNPTTDDLCRRTDDLCRTTDEPNPNRPMTVPIPTKVSKTRWPVGRRRMWGDRMHRHPVPRPVWPRTSGGPPAWNSKPRSRSDRGQAHSDGRYRSAMNQMKKGEALGQPIGRGDMAPHPLHPGGDRGVKRRMGAKRRKDPLTGSFLFEKSGGVLLSQGVSSQVPSALVGLTSVFGMGTGVTPPP